MDDICHYNSLRCFLEVMLMMPKTILSEALLVDEKCKILHMRDFSGPIHPNLRKGLQFVSYNHPRIQLSRQFPCNRKVHPIWSQIRPACWHRKNKTMICPMFKVNVVAMLIGKFSFTAFLSHKNVYVNTCPYLIF